MPQRIYILEDDQRRREAMRDCLADRFHQYPVEFFESASEMIRCLKSQLHQALLISLDHDLEPTLDEDGRAVADWLALQGAVCPIILHSSNADAAVGMQQVLLDAHWSTFRSFPSNDLEWIYLDWFPTVRSAIMDAIDRSLADSPSPSQK